VVLEDICLSGTKLPDIENQNFLTSDAIDIKYDEIRKTTKLLFGPNVNIDW
jgi:hypothetical protein